MAHLRDQLEIPKCPHCNVDKPLLHSTTQFETTKHDGANKKTWRTYACRTCGGAILAAAWTGTDVVREMYPSGIKETFDLTKVPPEIAEDFNEALECYSVLCFNAFGAMARRTVQSISENLGAKGSDKVMSQLQDLKEMTQVDDETFEILRQVVIGGHDGVHPHLPKLSQDRASILLELMKDVLYQLYLRKAKVQEAIELRKTKK